MNETILPGTRSGVAAASPLYPQNSLAPASAVSWAAIFAGAAGAAALSLILLILGVGLGLSSVSPWSGQGASADTIGVSTIVWITFTQLAAAGMGGYLAGRLRTRWLGLHTDEVYFRDTAHGFLSWAIATLATAALLTSAIGGIVSGGVQAGSHVASGAASAASTVAMPAVAAGASQSQSYYVDGLFRKAASPASDATAVASVNTISGSSDASAMSDSDGTRASGDGGNTNFSRASTAEAGRILANAMRHDALPNDDAQYLGQLVAQRTGMSQADAEKRVNEVYGRMQTSAKEAEATARNAADKARKASAYSALWLFVSLLVGAFVASLAATFGGRQRDLF